jgi:hypothetical protein
LPCEKSGIAGISKPGWRRVWWERGDIEFYFVIKNPVHFSKSEFSGSALRIAARV